MTAVKENINGNKYVTLNSEPGNRETAMNIYISQRLSDKYDVDEHLPLQAVRAVTAHFISLSLQSV